jgi:hypothetical protein
MYYPSRISQLVDEVDVSAGHPDMQAKIQAIDELVMYYKELYALMSAQAMRQIDNVKHECRPITLYGEPVLGEEPMLRYLFEILQKQSGSKTFHVETTDESTKYVSFRVKMEHVAYREFFTPSIANIPFLICRQIVRENSEYTNRRGCGIVSVRNDDGSTTFVVTLAKASA